ncbi:hypothetical protein DOY81_011225, partial [Sarcophaga bullata]
MAMDNDEKEEIERLQQRQNQLILDKKKVFRNSLVYLSRNKVVSPTTFFLYGGTISILITARAIISRTIVLNSNALGAKSVENVLMIHDDLEKDHDFSGSGFGPDDEDSDSDYRHHSHKHQTAASIIKAIIIKASSVPVVVRQPVATLALIQS